jgi:hypothetical protein
MLLRKLGDVWEGLTEGFLNSVFLLVWMFTYTVIFFIVLAVLFNLCFLMAAVLVGREGA